MGTTSHTVNSADHVHQRLGYVQLLTQPSKTNPHETITIMKKIIPVRHDKEFQVWQGSLNRIKNTQTQDVIFFPQHYHFEGAGMCGSTGVITLMFPDYFFVLQSQIRNREKHDQPFLETEIWYLLYNMIRAAKEYEKFNEKVGDIRPANIVINENGHIKVISVHTCPGQLTNYEKAIESKKQNVFLSPEECREQYIKIGQYPGSASKTQSQIFSIGVTLLQSIILKDCTILYSKIPYKFNIEPYQRYKNDLRNTFYSEHLKHLVLRMLDMNAQNRPKASEIYQTLLPFEDNILDLEQFRFPNQQTYMNHNQAQFIQPYSMQPSITVQQPLSPRFIQPQNINSLIQQRSVSPQYKTVHQQFNQQISKSFVPVQSYQQRTYQ